MNNEDVSNQASQDLKNDISNATRHLTNSASNAVNKKIRKATSEAGKKAAKLATRTIAGIVKATVTTLLNILALLINPITLVIVGILLMGLFAKWVIDESQADNKQYTSEVGTSSGLYDEANALNSVFYEKYSDQSFYYVLEEPETDDKDYSGKTYEELNGIKSKGLTQASQKNYIQDVDKYEENIKLQAGFLSVLDNRLNGAGSTGFYNPEQFLKMLALEEENENCNLKETDDKEIDITGCKLATIDPENLPMSTAYSEIGEYYKKAGTETNSLSDYGLASLVHYKALYQPSRINDYKLKTTTIVDENWKFGDAGSPYKTVDFSTLSKDEQDKILAKYKNPNVSNGGMLKSSSNNEGMISNSELGLYPVEDEIVYKDWIKLKSYDLNRWDEWGKSEPEVSTGVLDTEVVYAIDSALVYFQKDPLKFDLTGTWTDLDTAIHEQTATYLKDYTSPKATNHAVYSVQDYPSAEGLKRLYNSNGTLLGYIKEAPEWKEGSFESSHTPVRKGTTTVHNTQAECEAKYIKSSPNFKQNVANCMKETHQVDTYYSSYDAVYTPGYWEYKLVRDANGNPTSVTGKINEKDKEECHIEKTDGSDAKNSCSMSVNSSKEAKDKYKTSQENNWNYQPSYLFSISSTAEGQLQTLLYSHKATNISTGDNTYDYLRGYIGNYETYIPSEMQTFQCTENPDGTGDFKNAGSIISDCEESEKTPYLISNSERAHMDSLNITKISDGHQNKIKEILGLNGEEAKNDVTYSEEGVSIPTSVKDELNLELKKINKDYGKEITNASKKYGIDPNLLKAMIVAAKNEGKNFVECDGTCSLEKIFIFDEVKSGKRTVRDITIDSSASKKKQINFMGAKLQRLMEQHDGNLLQALLEYNLGKETYEAVINVYAEQTGLPKEEIIQDHYDTGWYHYITEVLDNTTKYNISPLSTADRSYIQSVVTALGRTGTVKWTQKPSIVGVNVNTSEEETPTTISIWTKLDIYDRASNTVGKSTYNSTNIKALYNLKKNDGENYKKYWKLLTFGQKGEIETIDSADYIKDAYYLNENGDYDKTINLPENAIKKTFTSTKLGIDEIIKIALAFDSDTLYGNMDYLSGDYWLSKFGKKNVSPDYTKIVGRSLEAPAKEYETLQSAGFTAGELYGDSYSTSWIIKTPEDELINTITNEGIVSVAENDTVMVEIEKYNTTITYTGLKDLQVQAGDDVKNKTLGASTGKVSISVWHNNAYYDMEKFLQTANSNLSYGSGLITGFLGGECLSYEESMALWDIINGDLTVNGGALYNCTRFTNYMIGVNWNVSGVNIFGDGKDKVQNIVNALGSMVVGVQNELPTEGQNIAFSYSTGQYGHTGWIDEVKYDTSMEGNGYVIVSEGNIGANHLIRLKQKYTYDQWFGLVGNNAEYTWLS